jgi:hypothetical protein
MGYKRTNCSLGCICKLVVVIKAHETKLCYFKKTDKIKLKHKKIPVSICIVSK